MQQQSMIQYTGWAKKRTVFLKFVTPVYADIEYRSIYQTVHYFIQSKTGVLCVTVFKYSLHNFSVRTLRSKQQLILAMTFICYMHFI